MEYNRMEIVTYYKSQSYQTQAQKTYDMLLEMIALDAFPEKSVYTELELTQMLQVGRTPLRDALRLLEFDSITETIPRLGVQIREVHIDDYFLQTEVRTALEFVVIRRACRLITKGSQERLAQMNEGFASVAKLDDEQTLYRIDRSIHALIDESCKNPYAVHALAPLRFFEQRVHYCLGRIYPDITDTLNEEHIRYVNDIVTGDVDSACSHFRNMIDSTLKLVKLQVDTRRGWSFSDSTT